MALFREEVSDYRKVRLHGEVVLIQPLSNTLMVVALVMVVGLALFWLISGTYARTETVPGILTTDKPSAKIIVPASGLVTKLLVQDGASVRKGQPLVVIDLDRRTTTGAAVGSEEIDSIDSRRAIARAQIALSRQQRDAELSRLKGVISGTSGQMAYLQSQIKLQKEVVSSNQQMFDQIEPVMKRGFISKFSYEERRQNLIASKQTLANLEEQYLAKLSEAENARSQFASTPLESAHTISDIQASMEMLSQQRAQLEGEKAYIVTAPITGRVTAIQTAQGRMAQPGLPMMIIVPNGSRLSADLYAPSRAVGFVRPGQETRLLFDSFPYQRFGSFAGHIRAVSRTVIDSRESDVPLKLEGAVYRITVTLDGQMVKAYGENIPLQPGMTLQANIILERQSFLDWFLQPFHAVLKRTV